MSFKSLFCGSFGILFFFFLSPFYFSDSLSLVLGDIAMNLNALLASEMSLDQLDMFLTFVRLSKPGYEIGVILELANNTIGTSNCLLQPLTEQWIFFFNFKKKTHDDFVLFFIHISFFFLYHICSFFFDLSLNRFALRIHTGSIVIVAFDHKCPLLKIATSVILQYCGFSPTDKPKTIFFNEQFLYMTYMR